MTDQRAAALDYAAHGTLVAPLYEPVAGRCSCPNSTCPSPAKHPRTPRGLSDATRDVSVITAWWRQWPTANVAALTGGAGGSFVADLDGPAAVEAFVARFGKPRTAAVRTSRGFHLYFRMDGAGFRNSAGRLGPKIDVRGEGGYVVGAGSVHVTGHQYAWVTVRREPAAAPPALRDALHAIEDARRPVAVSQPTGPLPIVEHDELFRRVSAYLARVGSCPEGRRNETAFSVAAWLRRDMALPNADAWAWLVAWNAGNAPPLAERELAAVFSSAGKTGRRAYGCGLVEVRT